MKSSSLQIASESLRANILTMPSGKFLTASQNQFLTLWTRDFCHSIRGLLVLNEDDVVRDHLSFLLNSLSEDGLVPRVLDNRMVQVRVVWQSARKLIPFLPKLSFQEPLKPQYEDEHGSRAIDSNLLVLLGAYELRKRSGGEEWWQRFGRQLDRVFHYYDDKFKNGLIDQPGFSDWQDSAKRKGASFLTNLLYVKVCLQLEKEIDPSILWKFYDVESGLFRTMLDSSIVSVDGNLMVLDMDGFLDDEQKKDVWLKLCQHALGRQGFGMCSVPDYPSDQIALHVRLASLDGYHGHLAWSWLMGLALKVAYQMGDESMATNQRGLIDSLLHRDQTVLEIYDPGKQWQGWESWLLRAERPFAWGSAYLVEALHLSPVHS